MLHAILTGVKLQETLENTGHQNWDPMDFPDWLLVELDGDLLIRPGQIDVALAIISPPSGANSVLQMNMGQGEQTLFWFFSSSSCFSQQHVVWSCWLLKTIPHIFPNHMCIPEVLII